MSRPTRSTWIAILTLALLATPAVSSSSHQKNREAEDRGHLRLRLTADPAVGFTPVTTILTAHLTGVAPTDPNFCHPAVTWVRINPGQTEDNASRYHEDPACRHPESESVATTTFTKTFDLYQPGSHLFKLVVEGKDHQRAESGYVRVEVIRVQ